ncbi:MAG: rhomboid family intramembrane serine protease [Ignavibacteriaceae bacterium]|nr:rhomboid family intramembrane serine protease [Ignavibacteriaceae bacterium]
MVIGELPGWYVINKWFALNPISGLDAAGMPYNFQVWQLITYQFMHGNFSHILFNMFALWMFGMEVENMWGSKKFLYFYLSAGIAAGLLHLFLSPLLGGGAAVTIGASGSIFGVLTAFALLFPDRLIFLYFFIPVKAKYLIAGMILLEFLLVDSANSGVAHLAHLGGALLGFIWILADPSINADIKRMFKRNPYQTNKPKNPFGSMGDMFKKKDKPIEDATFYEVNDKNTEQSFSQKEIDAILDKISHSGYQNLTEHEKKILFEASKKMR